MRVRVRGRVRVRVRVTVTVTVTVSASAIVTRDVPDDTTVVGVNKLVEKKDPESDEYTWFYDI